MKKPKNINKFIKKNKRNIFKSLIVLLLIITAIKGGLYLIDRHSVSEVIDDSIPYTIRGVDVSSYQGNVDWKTLKKQGISFAFIKATEGSGWTDKQFKNNWDGTKKAKVKRGAYHFFSFTSDPIEQAGFFIDTVPKCKDALPPVVDFEAYGKFVKNPPSPKVINSKLQIFIDILENHYQVKPIIYCNLYFYKKYISGNFDNPIWLANPSMPQTLPDGRQWEFLQYSFHGVLDGYDGIKHIDLNVFRGTKNEFLDDYY